MTVNYNVTGSERKRLADYIAGFLGCEKKYLGAPSFAYQVGYLEVSKDGAITFDDRADSKEIETLLEELENEGFHAEIAATQEAPLGLTISLPLDKANVGNLTNLLDVKGALIKKALGIDSLPIEIAEYTIAFPWFEELPGQMRQMLIPG